jgi:hypothetical protein
MAGVVLCWVTCWGDLAEHEPELCRGTGGYIYVLACLYVFTLFALEAVGCG